MTLYVDVSHHDRDRRGSPLDWERIAQDTGQGTVMLARASYGDPAGYTPGTRFFAELQAGARDAGYTHRGAYHNLIRGDVASIARQVDYLRREMDATGCAWGMCDVEPYAALRENGLWPRWEDALRFRDRWAAVESRVMAWYIARWVWSGWLGQPDLTQLPGPLVNAHYPPATPPATPERMYATAGGVDGPGWQSYGGRSPDMWQYTSVCSLEGASARTDLDAYRGSVTELVSLLGGGMEPNPNPARITDASWWFMCQLLALEPSDSANAGIYANKAGYHNTRANLLARDEWRGDYSIRSAADKAGPPDKAAAYDWTIRSAQRGDYTTIMKYGRRVEAAFNARDPRLSGWREVLIQADPDLQAEGFDFQGWYRRTPDNTHLWHMHASELRVNTPDYRNKRALLSVLRGESLATWRANEEDDMPLSPQDLVSIWTHDLLNGPGEDAAYKVLNRAAADSAAAKLAAGKALEIVTELAARPTSPADPAALKAALLDPEVLAAIATAVNDEDHRRSAG